MSPDSFETGQVVQNQEIDLPTVEELESFTRLSRFGRYNAANNYFKENLRMYMDLFPVIAEYADSLLEQNLYGELTRLLSKTLEDHTQSDQQPNSKDTIDEDFTANELNLINVLYSFGKLHTEGSLGQALTSVRNIKMAAIQQIRQLSPRGDNLEPDQSNNLQQEILEGYDLTDAEVQIFIRSAQVAMIAARESDWVTWDDFQLPWVKNGSQNIWLSLQVWCLELIDREKPWEATEILKVFLTGQSHPEVLPNKSEDVGGQPASEEIADQPAGEESGDWPVAEEPAEPAAEEPADPAGEESGDWPAGEEPVDPAGEESGDPAGEEPADPAGEESGDLETEVMADKLNEGPFTFFNKYIESLGECQFNEAKLLSRFEARRYYCSLLEEIGKPDEAAQLLEPMGEDFNLLQQLSEEMESSRQYLQWAYLQNVLIERHTGFIVPPRLEELLPTAERLQDYPMQLQLLWRLAQESHTQLKTCNEISKTSFLRHIKRYEMILQTKTQDIMQLGNSLCSEEKFTRDLSGKVAMPRPIGMAEFLKRCRSKSTAFYMNEPELFDLPRLQQNILDILTSTDIPPVAQRPVQHQLVPLEYQGD